MSNPNNYEECDDCEHIGPDVVDYGHTVLCDDCNEDAYYDCDYNDRMNERKQMGFNNF